MKNLINEIKETQILINSLNKIENAKKIRKQNDEILRIKSGLNFEISYQVNNKIGEDAFKEINIEGFKNADMIFNQYRKLGHDLNLRYLILKLDGEKVQRVNFKYNDKRTNK